MMRATVAGIGMLALGLFATPVQGQTRVAGAVVVRSEPVIVVEHRYAPYGRAYGWRKRHGYRAVTVYYDGRRYYRHRLRPWLRAVIVFERKGRYYILEDDRRNKRRHHHHDDD